MAKSSVEIHLNKVEICRKTYKGQAKDAGSEAEEEKIEIDYFCQECENARQVKNDDTAHNVPK